MSTICEGIKTHIPSSQQITATMRLVTPGIAAVGAQILKLPPLVQLLLSEGAVTEMKLSGRALGAKKFVEILLCGAILGILIDETHLLQTLSVSAFVVPLLVNNFNGMLALKFEGRATRLEEESVADAIQEEIKACAKAKSANELISIQAMPQSLAYIQTQGRSVEEFCLQLQDLDAAEKKEIEALISPPPLLKQQLYFMCAAFILMTITQSIRSTLEQIHSLLWLSIGVGSFKILKTTAKYQLRKISVTESLPLCATAYFLTQMLQSQCSNRVCTTLLPVGDSLALGLGVTTLTSLLKNWFTGKTILKVEEEAEEEKDDPEQTGPPLYQRVATIAASLLIYSTLPTNNGVLHYIVLEGTSNCSGRLFDCLPGGDVHPLKKSSTVLLLGAIGTAAQQFNSEENSLAIILSIVQPMIKRLQKKTKKEKKIKVLNPV